MKTKLRFSLACLVITALLIGLFSTPQPTAAAKQLPGNRVLVFVSDGMRHDLMKELSSQGVMPTYQRMMTKGAEGLNGLVPNVPPNTGPSWTALATGAPPSITSVTNNSYHNNNFSFADPWYWGVSAWTSGENQAETIAEQAEEHGLSVAVLAWQTFDPGVLENGIVVDSYPDWLTARGIIANYDVPTQWSGLVSTGLFLSDTQVTLEDAAGWDGVPLSYSPPKETTFTQVNWMGTPVLTYDIYIYDSSDDGVVNYQQALVSDGKNVSSGVELAANQWSDMLPAVVDGESGGFYVKLIELEPDLSKFRLYFTPVTRIRAFPQSLEDDLTARYPALMPFDYSPYISGLVDADTFVEQHLFTERLLGLEIFPDILKTFKPDLALVGNEWTDAVQHRFQSVGTPGTPVYDPVLGPTYRAYIEQAYHEADKVLDALSNAMPDATVIATSDHGSSNTWMAINAGLVLQNAGLYDPSNRANSQAVPFSAGGTSQIYINLQGRNPDGVVPPEEYESVRQSVAAAFEALGPEVIERVVLKEDTATLETALGQTYNMLHPDTTGDVVVFSAPPYQFDAATWNLVLAPAPIYGQHGFLPDGTPDRYAVLVAAGPMAHKVGVMGPATVLDIAPTIAAILRIPAPEQSQGSILPFVKRHSAP